MNVTFDDTKLTVSEYIGVINSSDTDGECDYKLIYDADVLTMGVAAQMINAKFMESLKALPADERESVLEVLEALRRSAKYNV